MHGCFFWKKQNQGIGLLNFFHLIRIGRIMCFGIGIMLWTCVASEREGSKRWDSWQRGRDLVDKEETADIVK